MTRAASAQQGVYRILQRLVRLGQPLSYRPHPGLVPSGSGFVAKTGLCPVRVHTSGGPVYTRLRRPPGSPQGPTAPRVGTLSRKGDRVRTRRKPITLSVRPLVSRLAPYFAFARWTCAPARSRRRPTGARPLGRLASQLWAPLWAPRQGNPCQTASRLGLRSTQACRLAEHRDLQVVGDTLWMSLDRRQQVPHGHELQVSTR